MPKFVAAIDTTRIPVLGLTPESSGTAPSSPVTGQLWNDTSTTPDEVKYWNGSAWIRANGADLPAGTVVNSMVNASAAIALSKLATDPLARANHTGSQLASTVSDFDTQVRTSRLDQMAAPSASVSLNSQKITNLLAPATGTDAANKAYVDDARAGIAGVKDPVRVAAQANVTIASPGSTVDGVSMVAGERFLAPAQTTTTQNGVWIWNGAAVPATRAPDADAIGEILDGTLVAVAEGTNAGAQYIQTAIPSGAPGAWSMVWTIYTTSGTTYVGGAGLTLTGSTFDVVAADGSLTVSANDMTVGLVPIAKGGTNATTAAAARTNLAATTKFAVNNAALTAGVAANITHSLGTLDVLVQVHEITGGAKVEVDVIVVDTNTVSIKSDVAYLINTLRVVVIG